MSFLSIIPNVWGRGARMIYTWIKNLFAPLALSRTDSAGAILLAGSEKYADLFYSNSPALPDGWTRPEWMTHGIDDSHEYENHTEPFPAFSMHSMAEYEAAAMHAAHARARLLPAPDPKFAPDLTPINGMSAVRAPIRQHDDIMIHEIEARDAMRTALHFAAGKAKSRYQHSHPAFTSPKTPWLCYSSPLAGEMVKYIGKSYQSCGKSIRIASPFQIRLELETCLILAFAPYVLSDAFKGADGRNKIVPEILYAAMHEGAHGNPSATREVIQLCEEWLVDDGEDILAIWSAWKWVVKAYIGVIVLRDRRRQREEIIWAQADPYKVSCAAGR